MFLVVPSKHGKPFWWPQNHPPNGSPRYCHRWVETVWHLWRHPQCSQRCQRISKQRCREIRCDESIISIYETRWYYSRSLVGILSTYPIPSMYGYIMLYFPAFGWFFMENVRKYTIHGCCAYMECKMSVECGRINQSIPMLRKNWDKSTSQYNTIHIHRYSPEN